jgi:hypothetical protein
MKSDAHSPSPTRQGFAGEFPWSPKEAGEALTSSSQSSVNSLRHTFRDAKRLVSPFHTGFAGTPLDDTWLP